MQIGLADEEGYPRSGTMNFVDNQFDRSTGLLEQARYDLAFHLAIARAAANPVIETMFGSIAGLTAELMLRSLSDPEVTRASVPFHRQICEAIRERDPARARLAMERHLAGETTSYRVEHRLLCRDGRYRWILARGLAQGVVMLAAVVAVYAAGTALALPRPQLGAMAFLSLVVGNLGLIALNRSGESLWQALRAPNRAFWIVSGVATTLALAVTQLRVPAAWFDFAPPPAGASAIAVALPLLGVALIALLRPLRRGSRVDGAVR